MRVLFTGPTPPSHCLSWDLAITLRMLYVLAGSIVLAIGTACASAVASTEQQDIDHLVYINTCRGCRGHMWCALEVPQRVPLVP